MYLGGRAWGTVLHEFNPFSLTQEEGREKDDTLNICNFFHRKDFLVSLVRSKREPDHPSEVFVNYFKNKQPIQFKLHYTESTRHGDEQESYNNDVVDLQAGNDKILILTAAGKVFQWDKPDQRKDLEHLSRDK